MIQGFPKGSEKKKLLSLIDQSEGLPQVVAFNWSPTFYVYGSSFSSSALE
jgi:hypothetical protein